MSLFEDTNPRELKELLGQIHSAEMALPEFQRDFIWDPSATQELILSIALNYPAGSLLRIRNPENLFACREFQGAPELRGRRPTYLVLDGQQRLTSLYQAFFGVGEHRYFIDLGRLLNGVDLEEALFHLRATHKSAKRLDSFDTQASELIVPLSELKEGAGGFSRWTRKALRQKPNGDAREALEDSLSEIERLYIQTVDDYRFPVVTLSERTDGAAVCTIFETLNRTGVKLGVFELLTARFWSSGVNLRQLWQDAKKQHKDLVTFEVDPYYVLQVISLASRPTPICRRSDVLDLKPESIREWWDKAAAGVARALRFLQEECGVITPGWLPYATILNPLAAFLAKTKMPGGPDEAAIWLRLSRWYWCAVFGQAYENAPNSQSAKDLAELQRWMGGGEPPEAVAGLRFDPATLREITPRQRAVYRGAICLILRQHPHDFYKGEEITGATMREYQVDDHHIFPDAFLQKQSIPQRLRDCVLNRTLIDRQTNIRISARGPAEYMPEIETALNEHVRQFDDLLAGHLLPSGKRSPLYQNDFEAFLASRQERMWEEIKRLTGVEHAATE